MVGVLGDLSSMISWLACGGEVTFHDDIAPFIDGHCLPCHADGGASGVPLATFEEARVAAPLAIAAMRSGRMPPGSIDRSGDCATFLGPQPVDEDDIERFAQWFAEGTPEGPPTARSAAPPTPFAPDATFDLGPFDAGIAEQRCFLVDGAPSGFLDAFRVTATPTGAVHHAMLFALDDRAEATALDGRDGSPGWDCYGGPGVDASLTAVWTPGDPVVAFPAGTGVPLPGGSMVVQLHFGAADLRGGAVARIALQRAETVERTLSFLPIAATRFALQPGQPAVTWTETVPLPSDDLDVFGVFPHMHALGRSLALDADACLVQVSGWDYRWQEVAFYEEAVPLASGTPLTLSCTFSTVDATTTTVWGEGASDEMCMAFLLGSPRR